MVRLVIKYLLYGISLGCTFFVIMCLSFYVGGGQEFLEMIFRDFARQSLGAMAVGIACGGTSVVYQFDRFSGFGKVLIHLPSYIFVLEWGFFTRLPFPWDGFHSSRTGLWSQSYNFYLPAVFLW